MYPFTTPSLATTEARDSSTRGVLNLTPHPTSYDWEFVPAAGGTFTDSGSGTCVESSSKTYMPLVQNRW